MSRLNVNQQVPNLPLYYIGLPQWNHPAWNNTVHVDTGSPETELARYSSFFNSVEGNNTFYGLPKRSTVQSWYHQTTEEFKFCLKLPQSISHQSRLTDCAEQLTEFYQIFEQLNEKLGQITIQLPASFGPDSLPVLEHFITQLSSQYIYTLEVRHPGFFDKGDNEIRLNQLLIEQKVNRTMFDTRALFNLPALDPAAIEARKHKPNLPLHVIDTADAPVLRFITSMPFKDSLDWLNPWYRKVTQWIAQGKKPYLFFHTPDNNQAPELARHFSLKLQQQLSTADVIPEWPVASNQQETLF